MEVQAEFDVVGALAFDAVFDGDQAPGPCDAAVVDRFSF
jgi:hypothetical protein